MEWQVQTGTGGAQEHTRGHTGGTHRQEQTQTHFKFQTCTLAGITTEVII
jgi:hypothetical protein